MKLRPYQQIAIDKTATALEQRNNTLAVAPTGAGKTVIIASVIDEYLKKTGNKKRVLVLVHRSKINFQNQATFERLCSRKTSFFISGSMILSGQVIFGMIQTVSNYTKQLPPFDMLVIDEGHHARADTYDKLIEDQKNKNPKIAIMAITATPNRADKKGLVKHFTNIAFQIKLKELIELGYLVRPVAKVIKLFEKKERNLISNSRFWSQGVRILVDEIRNNQDRKKFVVFVSGVGHMQFLEGQLRQEGIKAISISSLYSDEKIRDNLRSFEEGKAKVLINIDIATEGYDFPPIDCVVLLRAVGNKTMLLQMVGRGLRVVDKIKYPQFFKKDCLVLDFGMNFQTFGDLEQEPDLVGKEKRPAFLERNKSENPKEKEEIGLLPTIIYNIDLYRAGHFESFCYKENYIKGICGFNKSLFIVNGKQVFFKNDKLIKKLDSKKELEEAIQSIKKDHNKFFETTQNQAITDFQCELLVNDFDISGASRYRASVIISFFVNKKKYFL